MLHWIGFIIIGGIAGWLAGLIMTGKGMGFLMDIVLGVIGGFVGGWILSLFLGARPQGIIVEFVTALVGACILVAIIHLVRRQPLRTG